MCVQTTDIFWKIFNFVHWEVKTLFYIFKIVFLKVNMFYIRMLFYVLEEYF